MKKLIIILTTTVFLFSLNLTFTKAFNYFRKGEKLEKTNPKKANEYFIKAYTLIQALPNKKTSQVNYMLGKMYCNGWGVKQDLNKAEKYFLEAIKLGNKRANCCITRLYIKKGDLKKARKYLNIALSNKAIANYCNDIDPNSLKIKGE